MQGGDISRLGEAIGLPPLRGGWAVGQHRPGAGLREPRAEALEAVPAAQLENRVEGRAAGVEGEGRTRVGRGELLVHEHARARAEAGAAHRLGELEVGEADLRAGSAHVVGHAARRLRLAQARAQPLGGELCRRLREERELVARVEADARPETLSVVTSDRELSRRVRAAGARVVSSGEFRRRLDSG